MNSHKIGHPVLKLRYTFPHSMANKSSWWTGSYYAKLRHISTQPLMSLKVSPRNSMLHNPTSSACSLVGSLPEILPKQNKKIEHAKHMVDLWLLGDHIGVPDLQNAAVEALCGYPAWFSDPDLIPSVYKNTRVESKLRELLVAAYAYRSQLTNFEVTTTAFGSQINRDIAVALKNIARRSDGKKLTAACYFVPHPLGAEGERSS